MADFETIEQIQTIIADLLEKAGLDVDVEFEDSINKGLIFNITSRDSRLLIGRQGATLHALDVLVHAIVARKFANNEQPPRFTLDVDDYKRKREWWLKENARNAAEQVTRTGHSLALDPMPNYERRIIHAYLQEHHPEVITESQGRDPERRIVIKPA